MHFRRTGYESPWRCQESMPAPIRTGPSEPAFEETAVPDTPMPSEPSELELKLEQVEQYALVAAVSSFLLLFSWWVPIIGEVLTPLARLWWWKILLAYLVLWIVCGGLRAYRHRERTMDRIAVAVLIFVGKVGGALFAVFFRFIWDRLLRFRPFAALVERVEPKVSPIITWIRNKIHPPEPVPEEPEIDIEPEPVVPKRQPVTFFRGGISTEILNEPDQEQYSEAEEYMMQRVADALTACGLIGITVHGAEIGPRLASVEIELPEGMRMADLKRYREDLEIELETPNLVFKGGGAGRRIRIDVPLPPEYHRSVSFREVMESREAIKAKGELLIAMGQDLTGKSIIYDLRTSPHLLIAGGTGSGKSNFVHSLIVSLLFRYTPDKLRLIIIDPKSGTEFGRYEGIPHLLLNVARDEASSLRALEFAVRESLRRYREVLAPLDAQDLEKANAILKSQGKKPLPYIVVIVDEVAQLLMSGGKEINEGVMSQMAQLAQLARASGIHLILITQRPDAKTLDGKIRSNILSRVCLKVGTAKESEIVIDEPGGERLLGRGDMWLRLENHSSSSEKMRAQSAYIDPEEIKRIVAWWRNWAQEHNYDGERISDEELIRQSEMERQKREMELRRKALIQLLKEGELTVAALRESLQIGKEEAQALINWLWNEGLMSKPTTRKPGICTLSEDERRARLAELMKTHVEKVRLAGEAPDDIFALLSPSTQSEERKDEPLESRPRLAPSDEAESLHDKPEDWEEVPEDGDVQFLEDEPLLLDDEEEVPIIDVLNGDEEEALDDIDTRDLFYIEDEEGEEEDRSRR